MSELQLRELEAYYAFLSTFSLPHPIVDVSDLRDGSALFEVLSTVDQNYFSQSTRPSAQPSDNWVLRFSALKRLYRLMTQYFSDVLNQPTGSLEVPDLQAMAKESDVAATLIMCHLTVAIAVHCEQNAVFIEKIQGLKEQDQHYLMRAIEQVMSNLTPSAADKSVGDVSMTEDDHYYQLQYERSRVLNEKETVEKLYQTLLDEHRTLQTSHDDALSEKADALAQARQLRAEIESRRNDNASTMMKSEIDRLRAELQKSEDNLAMAESELDKHTSVVTDLTRKVDELQVKADIAEKLKDQVDEYRHAADRLQKTENVMEKYKKKLQEGADLRQQVKSLEKQNADLVDKNASLEEEYRKVSAFKPLIDSYRTQISDLETKASIRNTELDTVKFELEQTRTKLRIAEEARANDAESLQLYQDRVRELELRSSTRGKTRAARITAIGLESPTVETGPSIASELLSPRPSEADDDDDELLHGGLGDELDDAIAGTTMTDLKLQVRSLTRELEAARTNQAEASRVLVLESLLEDANRMKARYEADYLGAHREKLKLQSDLEDIRSGKALGDGAEAAIALRQRLNETVDQLDELRREHAELEVKHESLSKELTIAKSDLNLVNKDQLEILATLRESVNEDKSGLEAETLRLESQIRELSDKNRMQLEQINGLLMEKVNLQTDGIGQREKMLQRERDIGDLRAVVSGKDVPEEVKSRLLGLHEDNVQMKEQIKTLTDKLLKAKQFIKSQDKLFKEEHAKSMTSGGSGASFEEAETSFRSEIKILKEDGARKDRERLEQTMRYRREQEQMLGVIHVYGMMIMRGHLGSSQAQNRPGPTSWLGQQRRNLGQGLQR